MKKILTLVLLAGMASFYACGPSAEQKAAAEKAKQDSIAAAESVNKAAMEATMQAQNDSLKMAEAEKAMADSAAKSKPADKK